MGAVPVLQTVHLRGPPREVPGSKCHPLKPAASVCWCEVNNLGVVRLPGEVSVTKSTVSVVLCVVHPVNSAVSVFWCEVNNLGCVPPAKEASLTQLSQLYP